MVFDGDRPDPYENIAFFQMLRVYPGGSQAGVILSKQALIRLVG